MVKLDGQQKLGTLDTTQQSVVIASDSLHTKTPAQEQNAMPTDEVKHYATKFKLTWRQIYQLDSEFKSLIKIEDQEIRREIERLNKDLFQQKQNKAATRLKIKKLQEKIVEQKSSK